VKFDVLGSRRREGRGEARESLGERRVPCYRCGRVLPESELRAIPPGAGPGESRILVCGNCSEGSDDG
jgi:hypothetical protein